MKRLLAALTLALLLSLVVGAGVAYADHGTDYARGNVNQFGGEWRFSASSNFNGTDPQGTVRFIDADFDPNVVVTGRVTCLRVQTNTAFIVAEVTDVRGGGGVFSTAQSMLIQATDSGRFSPFPDFFGGSVTSIPATQFACTTQLFQSTVQDGEVIVHDSF